MRQLLITVDTGGSPASHVLLFDVDAGDTRSIDEIAADAIEEIPSDRAYVSELAIQDDRIVLKDYSDVTLQGESTRKVEIDNAVSIRWSHSV